MERYYLAETTGWLEPSEGKTREPAGVTAMVLDRLNLHRPAVMFRSEEMPRGPGARTRAVARERAARACAQLNAGGALPTPELTSAPHGTQTRYRYGKCRCAACTNANRLKCLAYRQRRRARQS